MYRYIHNHDDFHCHFSFRSAAATAHPFRFIRAVRSNVSSTALDCCPSAPAPSSGKRMLQGSPLLAWLLGGISRHSSPSQGDMPCLYNPHHSLPCPNASHQPIFLPLEMQLERSPLTFVPGRHYWLLLKS